MKWLDRVFDFVEAVNAGELPPEPPPAKPKQYQGMEQCAPGIDSYAAARLRHWLDMPADPKGPQPRAAFEIDRVADERDGGVYIWPVPRLR